MPFEHSCFISYSNDDGDLTPKIIEDLYNALSDEIGPLMRGKGVYLDRKRLNGGDIIDPSLATALCHSVCMIMVYTRNYFHKKHTYCTREFKAMEILEEKRLARLEMPWNNSHGLIIPIIFRGKKYFPASIGAKRNYYDFTDYIRPRYKGQNILATHKRFACDIVKIAESVCDRYDELKNVWESKEDCRDFSIPAEEEVIPWLNQLNGASVPFPYCDGGMH